MRVTVQLPLLLGALLLAQETNRALPTLVYIAVIGCSVGLHTAMGAVLGKRLDRAARAPEDDNDDQTVEIDRQHS